MLAAEITDKAGCRVDGQAGAGDDHQVCFGDDMDRVGNDGVIQAFFVEDDIRLDPAAAIAVRDRVLAVLHEFGGEELAAVHAVVPVDTAVEFKDLFAAGCLVKPVDVLGDDTDQFAFLFPFGQLLVGFVRLGIQGKELVPVEFEEFLRFLNEKVWERMVSGG